MASWSASLKVRWRLPIAHALYARRTTNPGALADLVIAHDHMLIYGAELACASPANTGWYRGRGHHRQPRRHSDRH